MAYLSIFLINYISIHQSITGPTIMNISIYYLFIYLKNLSCPESPCSVVTDFNKNLDKL